MSKECSKNIAKTKVYRNKKHPHISGGVFLVSVGVKKALREKLDPPPINEHDWSGRLS